MPHRAVGDPNIAAAGNPQAVAVTASPFTYTNGGPNTETMYFSFPAGATVTIARGGQTLVSILTPAATTIAATILVPPGASVVVTYSAGAPTAARDVV